MNVVTVIMIVYPVSFFESMIIGSGAFNHMGNIYFLIDVSEMTPIFIKLSDVSYLY